MSIALQMKVLALEALVETQARRLDALERTVTASRSTAVAAAGSRDTSGTPSRLGGLTLTTTFDPNRSNRLPVTGR